MSNERNERFTPGPWRVEVVPRRGLIIRANQWDVAKMLGALGSHAQDADAHLIADAPLLLTFLSRLLDWTDVGCEDPTCGKHSELRAVVNAARELVDRHSSSSEGIRR